MRLSNFLDFYVLVTIDAKSNAGFNHAKEKLIVDAKRELDELAHTMAQALHDYIFVTSFGECRHAYKYIQHTLDALPIPIDRNDSYKIAAKHNPRDCYPYIVEILSEKGWISPYGGKPWANVALALDFVYKQRLPDIAFVDYCADLKHNGGPIFNKPIIFSDDYDSDALLYILETKKNADDFCKTICDNQGAYVYSQRFMTWKTASLINRYMALYYHEYPAIMGSKNKIEYTPMKFGIKKVSIVESRNKRPCHSCGKTIFPGDSYYCDDERYCKDCYDELDV